MPIFSSLFNSHAQNVSCIRILKLISLQAERKEMTRHQKDVNIFISYGSGGTCIGSVSAQLIEHDEDIDLDSYHCNLIFMWFSRVSG